MGPDQTLVLVRHGETEWSENGRLASRTDISLTAAGRREAARLGTQLAGVPVSRLFSSPRRRALETAEGIRSVARCPQVETVEDLAEQDFGEFEGLRVSEVARQAPDWWRVGGSVTPTGVESPEVVVERMGRLFARSWDGVAVAVGHGVASRLLLASVLSMPLGDFRRLVLDTGRCAVLSGLADGRRRVMAVNSLNIAESLSGAILARE